MENENLNILIWAIGGGFSGTWAFMLYLIKKIANVDLRLSGQISKLDEKLTDVDRRFCRLEGAFSRQECCVIRENHEKRAQ